jgi:hypothetical protein
MADVYGPGVLVRFESKDVVYESVGVIAAWEEGPQLATTTAPTSASPAG